MSVLDVIILAVIQGITEFLPISSSGHLALWPLLSGHDDQGVTMDVAVHLGTLVAVSVFFRRDLQKLVLGSVHIMRGQVSTDAARLVWLLMTATVPAVLVGLWLKLTGYDVALRSIAVIGWATLIGGVFLWIADRFAPRTRSSETWSMRDAVLMGFAQAFALIPGASRSGVTMMAARALGFKRAEAARLALLMAVPIILAAGTLETIGVLRSGDFSLGLELVVGAALSFSAAIIALRLMMAMFTANWTMTPFVIYRLILGTILLFIAYG